MEDLTNADNNRYKGKRFKEIDMIRGMTILMVVVGHIATTNQWINDLLRDFRMPLFFVITGYLFSPSKYVSNLKLLIKTKFISHIIPYFSSGILVYLLWILSKTIKNDEEWISTWYKPLEGLINGNLTSGWQLNNPIWFLNCIFITIVIFCVFMRFTMKLDLTIQTIIIITLSLIGFIISKFYYLPWNLDVAVVSQIFVFIGFKIKELKLFKQLCEINLLSLFLLFIFLIISFFNTTVDMANRLYGNIFLFYINGILGSILLFKLASVLSRLKFCVCFLKNIGEKSLPILIFHAPFIIVISKFLGNNVQNSILNWSITFIVAVIGPLTLNILIEKVPLLNFLFNGNNIENGLKLKKTELLKRSLF